MFFICRTTEYLQVITVKHIPYTVAILAKNGACSVETKARLASFSVEPPGRLKYLIVYGDSRSEIPAGLRPLDLDPAITVGILHVDERSGRGTFVSCLVPLAIAP
jgi:hypothetical protein